MKRCPNPFEDGESEIEIRQVFEAEDFGAEFTPELRAQEERLRAEVEARKQLIDFAPSTVFDRRPPAARAAGGHRVSAISKSLHPDEETP